ncbi:acyl-CoA dehydrogenase family protein [Patulibacter sp.]|uniref:acyl-CoA dehydrogenase family protein n=1 Tax=Patulibacter sp. TaxID=1912859 RepID=UPI002724F7AC|nr:acyl-CoA dehydrogenase family protein [Patulibacter sp.]MDO9407265.1 acyl-CoA dehydrogenase family protein [Patulibacter sp.]
MATVSGTAPFHLDEDQREIAAMARQFADDRIAPGAIEWDEEKRLPVDVLREAAELGLGAIYCAEEFGGSGMTRLDAALIFEALGTGCPTIAAYTSIHNMATWMVDTFGDDEQRARWVPGLASMETLGAYCLTEAGAGSDAAALATTAKLDGDHYVLNGAKQFISGAGTAGIYVIMARTGGAGPKGITAFVVEDGTPGLSFGKQEHKMGWRAQPTASVNLDDCRIPVGNRLGEEGGGFRIAMAGLDGGRLNIAACSMGGAQSALEKTVRYVGEREQFAQPIGRFQSVQFTVADMATELEMARTFLWRAASALDAGDADKTRLCAMAKRTVTDITIQVADQALQLHGGYGYLSEYGLEKIVRDLRAHQIIEGTNEVMRVIVARDLMGRV